MRNIERRLSRHVVDRLDGTRRNAGWHGCFRRQIRWVKLKKPPLGGEGNNACDVEVAAGSMRPRHTDLNLILTAC